MEGGGAVVRSVVAHLKKWWPWEAPLLFWGGYELWAWATDGVLLTTLYTEAATGSPWVFPLTVLGVVVLLVHFRRRL